MGQDMRSVGAFVLSTFVYSWPIFFTVDAWLVPRSFENEEFSRGVLTAPLGHMAAMAGPSLAAIVLWRWVHRV